MKAYNARKTPKEHWLFSKKGQKIHLVGYARVRISVKKKDGRTIPRKEKDRFKLPYITHQVEKIEDKHFSSIGRLIKTFEKKENINIDKLGLTRKDFANDLQNIDYISKQLERYKNRRKK